MKQLLLKAIRFYRKHISPHLPSMCKFYPTCSCYAIEAIETHGAFIGGLLTLRRLIRCSPLSSGGYDPVPPKKDRHKEHSHD